MMNKISCLYLFLLLPFFSQAQEKSIESMLSGLPGMTYEKTGEINDYELYVLQIRQPINHADTTKGFFNQKVFLSNRSFEKPTVMVTAGYNVNRNRISELTQLLEANQILVEHRYYGESMPDAPDYQFLNLKQATADLHRIRQLFSDAYPNQWISTGVSKGGATTIFYRYFYPNDVDVSVPYVAPINQAYEEPRIYHFLDTVGTKKCRKKIKAFQKRVLKNRAQLLPLLESFSTKQRVSYSYLSLEEAFEYAVMEYPFSFWQWGHDCEKIPDKKATIEEVLQHFLTVSNITFFGDPSIQHYSSHYYQSATEMGYYGYETSELKKYLIALPTDSNPMALFFPFEMTEKFDGQLLNDLNQWLETNGNQFVYVYGGNDTWSASAVPPNDKVDAEWFMLRGKHHGNARIASMNSAEKERLISTLKRWLEVEVAPVKN